MYPAIAASRSPESLYIDTTSLISKYNSSNLYASTVFISPFTPPSRTPLRTVRQISLLSPQSLLPTLSVSSDHPQCPHKIRQGSTEPNARTQPGVDQCAYHIDASVPPPPLVPDDLVTSAGDDLPGCVMQRDQAELLRMYCDFFHACPSFPSPRTGISGRFYMSSCYRCAHRPRTLLCLAVFQSPFFQPVRIKHDRAVFVQRVLPPGKRLAGRRERPH